MGSSESPLYKRYDQWLPIAAHGLIGSERGGIIPLNPKESESPQLNVSQAQVLLKE